MSDEFTIETGPSPAVKAGKKKEANGISARAAERAMALKPGTWFRIPGTAGKSAMATGQIIKWIRAHLSRRGVHDCFVGIAEDDGSVFVRKASEKAMAFEQPEVLRAKPLTPQEHERLERKAAGGSAL